VVTRASKYTEERSRSQGGPAAVRALRRGGLKGATEGRSGGSDERRDARARYYTSHEDLASQMAAFQAASRILRRRLRPFVIYILVLAATVLAYGVLFHVIMAWEGQDHTWFTGIYWALTVMSTLGFGDITFQSDLGRAFSTIVLLTGIVLLLIIMPFLFIQHVYAPWLEERMRGRVRELRVLPAAVRDHVLICDDDPIARGLIHQLHLVGVPAYLIEPDADRALQLRDAGVPVLAGEVDAVETYRAARAAHARLVFANESDTVNSNIVLTVRELSETVPIAAVAEFEDSIDVLELSGATHVLPLKQRLGEHLANRASA
jgi:voltage-gated potassium channel